MSQGLPPPGPWGLTQAGLVVWPLETVLQPGAPGGPNSTRKTSHPSAHHPTQRAAVSHLPEHLAQGSQVSPDLGIEAGAGRRPLTHSLPVTEFSGPQIKPPGLDHCLICKWMDSCEKF